MDNKADNKSDNKNKWQSAVGGSNNKNDITADNVDNNSEENAAPNQPQQATDLSEEVSKLNEKNLRLLAEIDNLRRRSKEDVEKTAKYAISNFVGDLVATVENFFLASSHAPREEIEKSEAIKNYAQAVDMTQKELMKILEKHNIVRIFPMDQKFDHNLHEALSQVESDKEEGIVVQVIQAGYKIGDRLLRPALVGVSKKKT